MAAHKAQPKGLYVVVGILLVTAIVTTLFWVLFFSGMGAATSERCYIVFERAFPAADGWLVIAALLASIGLLRRKTWGVLFALLAGGASIFLGLMDVLFNLENGIYLIASTEVAIEIVFNIWTLTLSGLMTIWYVWTRRRALL
jgi:hypothetical protein